MIKENSRNLFLPALGLVPFEELLDTGFPCFYKEVLLIICQIEISKADLLAHINEHGARPVNASSLVVSKRMPRVSVLKT